MTIPVCEPNNRTLAFEFNLTDGGNNYGIVLNEGEASTQLKLGPAIITLNEFALTVGSGKITNLTGDASIKIEGLGQNDPPSFDVKIGYSDSDSESDPTYSIGLKTQSPGSPPIKISVGGFELTISDLAVKFTSTELKSFTFDGGLLIPGLKTQEGEPALLEVDVIYDEDGFNLEVKTQAVFYIGNLMVSDFGFSLDTTNNQFKVTVTGVLTFTGLTEEGCGIRVAIEIDSDGNFTILGKVDPATKAFKILDIDMVRVYLNMIKLSKKDSQYEFAMGGLIENHIAIAGMDNLLPSELNLRNLEFGENFGLDLGVKWPSGLIVNIGGDGGGEINVPVNGTFGETISLDALRITYGSFSDTPLEIRLLFMGATIKLGPVAAVVDGLGLKALISKRDPETDPGNFGIVQIDAIPLYPSGLGVSLDTPVFRGGGYLYFNKDKGEYAGAVELAVMGMFSVTAIGMINSKMPDGQPGTSVLFIMCVEFSPGIALGFGFFLSGLGGMLGIHRTIMVDKLREGVKTGSISNILFPKNIIANISSIISNIRELFPIKREQFIISPMAAITFGVPTILRIDFGLAIEFASPVRLGILGVLRVILPDDKAALLKINVAFLGLVDIEKKMLSFDASLFDSRILTFGLEGDMALRLSWGEKKDFVISVGGFHPRYNPPAYLMIPSMKRLTLNILTGNPRLTLKAYFAITTNTVQFGAGIDFYFKVSKFKIVGEFGIDVLFQFSPFYFIADAYARLAVKLGDTTLLGISLEFTLEGPAPWKARGTAKFTILFITIPVEFKKTWGENRNTVLEDKEVLPLLAEAVDDNQNWRSISAAHGVPGVRMRISGENALILSPGGSIEIAQKIVPLNINIEKFGQYNPKDYTKFEMADSQLGTTGPAVDPDYVEDDFAPANFLKLSDDEKLKLPSFEKQAAGIRINGSQGALKTGSGVNRTVNYEQLLEDQAENAEPLVMKLAGTASLAARESAFMMTHGAMGRSEFSRRKALLVNPAKVRMQDAGFAAVNSEDLSPLSNSRASYMQARESARKAGPATVVIPFDIIKKS